MKRSAKAIYAARLLAAGVGSDLRPANRFAFARGLFRTAYEYVTLRPTIPSVDLVHLAPDASARDTRLEYSYGWWNIDANSLAALTLLAVDSSPRTIFEFGTYKGITTRQLAGACPEATLVTLHLPPSPDMHFTPGEAFHGAATEARISQRFGDSASFDFSPYVEMVDFVFVDASHEYEAVRNDSRTALQLVKPGGIVVWDDYTTWSGVHKCIDELSETLPIVHIQGTRLAALKL